MLELPAALVGHDLLFVRGRDRDHPIRHLDAPQQQLDALSVVHHPSVSALLLLEDPLEQVVVCVVGQAEVAEGPLRSVAGVREVVVVHLRVREVPVVAHVVDDEETSRRTEHLPPAVVGSKDEGDQAALPVVGDEDHLVAEGRDGGEDQRGLQRRPREEREPEQVVEVVVASWVTVHARALEGRGVLHKHPVDADGRIRVVGSVGRLPLVRVVDVVGASVQVELPSHVRPDHAVVALVGGGDGHDSVPHL
mmetsp:Transcript_35306/g.70626  ORF Transcript_35306/g.70626 Transcript_35306/m.70626 type:complete len:250 (-) Transcript_35306:1158-1907(-)